MKIKLYSFIAIVLSLIPSLCSAQAPDWTRVLQVNTLGTHSLNVVSADANSIYSAAGITSNISFEGVNYTPIGAKDMLILKTAHSGVISWVKQLNASPNGTIYANAIKADASGNIYVTGIISGTSTIGTSTISSVENINAVFLAKFDTDGNGLWATTVFDSEGSSSIRIETDASGNAYLICNSSKLFKISSTGTKVWEQTYPVRTLQTIAINGSNLFLGGCLQGPNPTTFGTITLTPSGTYNTGFIVKADLDGNYTNSVVVGGSPMNDGSSVSDIIFDNSGNLIVTGGFVKDLVLGTVNVPKPTESYYTYIAKCDNNFNFSWAKSSSDIQNYYRLPIWNYRVFLDNANNIYQYGYNDFSIKYGSIQLVSSGKGGQFLFKFDSNGEPINGYILNNTSLEKFAVTSGGKYVFGATYNQEHQNGYGNFYLTQLNNDLTENWIRVSSNCLSGTATIKYIKHDVAGNTYLLSRLLGRCDYFGTLVNSNTTLTVISKHDINGTLLWMNQIADVNLSSYGSGFVLDNDNNIITSGLFKTSLNFGLTTLTSSNSTYEGYVAKYSNAGGFVWAAKMDLGGNVNVSINVATDKDKNIIVSGVKSPSNYIVKFNTNGDRLWSKIFPMGSNYFSMVSTDNDKNIYLTSEINITSTGSTTIGTVTLNQTGQDGGTVLVKFDPDGNAIWAKTYGGVNGSSTPRGWPVNIITDSEGNSYVWGWCELNANFGTNTLTNPFTPNENFSFYLTKINTSGDVVWIKAIYEAKQGFNYGDLLDMDKDGNIYIGGHFKDKISLDGITYTPEGLNDFFAMKFSNEGTFQWIKTIPSNAGNIISALGIYANDVLSIAGLAGKNATLGSTTINRKNGSNCIVATLGNLKHLSVFSNTLTIAAASNSTNAFNITSNTSWTAISDQTWLTPSSSSGTGDASITLTASANPTAATRAANVTISGTDVTSKIVLVTQDAGSSGINRIEEQGTVNVYPNPSRGQFNLTLNGFNNENIEISVVNVLGNTIKKYTLSGIPDIYKQEFDLGNIANGLYFISIKSNKFKVVKTITISNP